MGALVREAIGLLDGYRRKGGKRWRRMQAERALRFAAWCEQQGARSWANVGRRWIIRYYKRLRAEGLSTRTIYYHGRAIAELWELLRLPGQPPEPWEAQTVRAEANARKASAAGRAR